MHTSVHAQRTPDKAAYVMADSGEVVTFRQLEDASNRFAQLLRSIGLVAGDRIALMLENHPRFFEICVGAHRAGIIFTAISSRLTAGEAAYIVDDCGAKVFVTSRALSETAAKIAADTPKVLRRLMLDATIDGHDAYEAAVAAMPAQRIADETAGGDMLYSSGTTGRPKGRVRAARFAVDRRAQSADQPVLAVLRLRARHGLPVAGAAVSRRTAALLDDRDAPGRHGGGDGALRRRALPASWCTSTGSPTPSWCRRCSCGCSSCRPKRAPGTTCRR